MTASVCSSSHPTKACPDSWKATTLCSSLDRILLFFTLPEDTHKHKDLSDFARVATETYEMYCFPRTQCLHHCTCYYSLHSILKVKGIDGLVPLSGSMQGCFVTNVSNVCTCRDKVSWQQRFHDHHMGENTNSVVMYKDVSYLSIRSLCLSVEASQYFVMATDVHRFTRGQNSKYDYTTEARGELSQTQRVEISWLGQLQDLQMLLKDLLPLLRDNNKNEKVNSTDKL